jgi:hypothetical protein
VDAIMVLNLAAFVISLVALLLSVFLNLRQIRVTSGGNHLPVVLDAFKESRSTAWFEAEEYVLNRLAEEHAAECGIRGLPIVRLWDALAPYVYEERRAHKLHFWVYFEDLAVRTAEITPEVVYAEIGLRRRPPRQDRMW